MSYKKIMALCLSITLITKPVCFTPQAGENLWRMVARIGDCLDSFSAEALSDLDQIEGDLLSIGDFLSSQIDAIDCASEETLLSVSDVLSSKIMAISTGSCSDELLLSVSDVLTTLITNVDTDLLSVGDFLSSQIDAIDCASEASLLSVSDTLTVEINNINNNLFSIGDSLSSKIMALDEIVPLINFNDSADAVRSDYISL